MDAIAEALRLAVQHHEAGRLREAEAVYRRILQRAPRCAPALHLLGRIAFQTENSDAAIALLQQAVAAGPGSAEAHNDLGAIFKYRGRLDEALACYRQAVAIQPSHVEALNNMGVALHELGRNEEAMACYRQALALAPDNGRLHKNTGGALYAQGRVEDAVAAYRRCIALSPSDAAAWDGLGIALMKQGSVGEALASFRQALAQAPDDAGAHVNFAYCLLLSGDLPQGAAELEWRRRMEAFAYIDRSPAHPLWNGKPVPDHTLLVHAEQGFGDTIQFMRFVPAALEHAGKMVLAVQPPLLRLVRENLQFPNLTVVPRNNDQPGTDGLPEFDTHLPMMSLLHAMDVRLETLAGGVPYLRASPALDAQWGERLGTDGGLRVGLAWAGLPTHGNDRNRSIPPAMLAPLGQTAGVSFFSLQKGPPAETQPPPGLTLTDLGPELSDFADTAACIANLDLVITVDTSIAHLAGAMGKPVWVMLPFAPDWRWMLGRDDSPWYPSARLFRQPAPGEWEPVVVQIAAALSAELANRG